MPNYHTCSGCGRKKAVSKFRHRNGKRISLRCKPCLRDERFRRRYGVTAAERDLMDRLQAGLCAICNEPPPKGEVLHLDHDHGTGTARELLCRPCNLLLGNARENPDTLSSAITYLERHRSP